MKLDKQMSAISMLQRHLAHLTVENEEGEREVHSLSPINFVLPWSKTMDGLMASTRNNKETLSVQQSFVIAGTRRGRGSGNKSNTNIATPTKSFIQRTMNSRKLK